MYQHIVCSLLVLVNFRSLLLLAGIAASTSAFSQVQYRLTEIPPLPGKTDSFAEAINDFGVVVGSSANDSFFTALAFRWTAGTLESLGTLPGAEYSYAHHINNAGVIVGEGDSGDTFPQAVRWLNGEIVNIEPNGGSNVRAIFVTASGVIIGNYAHGFSGNASSWRPTIWTERNDQPGQFRSVELQPFLGGDPNSDYIYTYGANDSQQVVGVDQSSLFGQYGAFWDNDANHTLTLLLPAQGYHNSYAYDVNNAGIAVGESVGAFMATRATLWQNNGSHSSALLPLPPRCEASTATAISDSGTIVGSGTFGTSSRGLAWVNGVPYDLQRLVAGRGGVGWTGLWPEDINAVGQIVGTGMKNGRYRGFVLDPITEARKKLP